MKQVGGYLQDAWKTLGALPILIWHVATMPLVDERGSTWWRDTVYFILVGFLVFILRVAYLVAEALVGKDEKNNGSLASRVFKFAASMGSSNVARTYHAAVNVVCEALLFVVLCHDGSSPVGTGLVSRHFSPSHPQFASHVTSSAAFVGNGTASQVGTEYAVFSSFVEQACGLALVATSGPWAPCSWDGGKLGPSPPLPRVGRE
jgi:hypothetical protein